MAVESIRKVFRARRSLARVDEVVAVDRVSFAIPRGQTLALVGESGSGKSTVGRMLLRLIKPDEGKIIFDGAEIQALGEAAFRPFRRRMQIVFQNPLGSLNPVLTIEAALMDALRYVENLSLRQRRERAEELLNQVGLDRRHFSRFPHEMSGGQLQRIALARALAPQPEFLFLDEPTSALDVSVRGQIVNLLTSLQEQLGLTYLFVSHDLSVVRHAAHAVAVMYLGQIVESGPSRRILTAPGHPYTRALLESARPGTGVGVGIRGEADAGTVSARGCRFASRCPYAEAQCHAEEPPSTLLGPDHEVRCWLANAH